MKPQVREELVGGKKKSINKAVGIPDSAYNNNNNEFKAVVYNTASTNRVVEDKELFNFVLNSRFNFNANLKLAYYLLHAQRASVSEASRVLGFKTRSVIYDSILIENPCFISAPRNGMPKEQGGHQRLIILGEDARPFLPEIEALGVIRLGEDVCLGLRMKASKAHKVIKKIEYRRDKILKSLAISRVSKPDQYPGKRRYWASRWNVGVEEVDKMVDAVGGDAE